MAIEVINRILTFNRPALEAEIAAITPALPAYTFEFSGFEGEPVERVAPFAEATRVIATRNGVEDTAARGDTRTDTRDALTPAQVASIEAALDAHDPSSATDNSEQTKERQHSADVASLRALFDAGIVDPAQELTTKLVLIDEGEDL